MKFTLKKKKQTSIPLVCLLIYLSIIPTQLSNYVLCIGIDGHVDFEVSANGHCIDTRDLSQEHENVMIAASILEENHCYPCIDFAIFVPLNIDIDLAPFPNPLTPTSVFVVTFVKYPTSAATIPTHFLFQNPSVADPILISLQSTMLRI